MFNFMQSLFWITLLASPTLAIPTGKPATSFAEAAAYESVKATDRYSPRTVYPVTEIPIDQINSYEAYTHLAAGSYCPLTNISNWDCGQHCSAVPGMRVVLTGGDNGVVPDFYVGYLPSVGAVVVHQGTDPESLLSLLVDADSFMTGLDPTYFPGLSDTIQVHSGFVDAHNGAAAAVLAAVEQVIDQTGTNQVVCIGHSLGGAIAILDALSLQVTLPSSISVKVVTYGQPRIGNAEFASYVDANVLDNTRITHNQDPIPISPGRALGFVHSSGEKHIDPSGIWWACAGQDNTADPQCSTGEVPSIFSSNLQDHVGPYNSSATGWSIDMAC